ncbi:hypothetical protein QR680_010741 [Steinernema hermaphroditum]|uniref:Uncharacterized protein n=1 Tax=Steinernema hermaphroditum TaxID=289476 RepID=A0AA39IQ00_9BILA|nr:hypothetical protein QR680_010741 [Steinernema hermaphroditum]
MRPLLLILLALSISPSASFLMCNYCASQDFYDDTFAFVSRQVTHRLTRVRYISTQRCGHPQNHDEIKCLDRCFTMVSHYVDQNGAHKTAEVRSCEVLHLEQEERLLYSENRCYERQFKGKNQTICFCAGKNRCNNGVGDFFETSPTEEPEVDAHEVQLSSSTATTKKPTTEAATETTSTSTKASIVLAPLTTHQPTIDVSVKEEVTHHEVVPTKSSTTTKPIPLLEPNEDDDHESKQLSEIINSINDDLQSIDDVASIISASMKIAPISNTFFPLLALAPIIIIVY